MKRFFIVVVIIFLAAGLYAEPKISEKQIEVFESKGSYIKVIVWDKESKSVTYINKHSIFEIFLNSRGEVYIFNDNRERAYSFDKEGLEDVQLDADNNLIFIYRY